MSANLTSMALEAIFERHAPALFRNEASPYKRDREFRIFFASLLPAPATALTSARLQQHIDGLPPGKYGPLAINGRMAMLNRLLTLAVAAEELPCNPMAGWRPMMTPSPRNRQFSPVERAGLWGAVEREEEWLCTKREARISRSPCPSGEIPSLRAWPFASPLTVKIVFAMATGVPRGLCERLEWSQLNLQDALLMTPLRPLPLANGLCELLQRWFEHVGGRLVFPDRLTAVPEVRVEARWNSLVRHSSVPDLHWNDFRTDFGNHLIALGAPHFHVRYLLGAQLQADASVVSDRSLLNAVRRTTNLRAAHCPFFRAELSRFAVPEIVP